MNSDADRTLADTFDDGGSDNESNDGDDRQRLLRGNPTPASGDERRVAPAEQPAGDGTPAHLSPRTPAASLNAPIRVYGGGARPSSNDGVFANLSAKPEHGEKNEEQPPVGASMITCSPMRNTDVRLDLRASCSRCDPSLLGNHHPRARSIDRRSLLRRSSSRFPLLLRLERHDKHVLPTRRLSPHLPTSHHACRQEWLQSGPGHHASPIRILHARLKLIRSNPEFSRLPIYSTSRSK